MAYVRTTQDTFEMHIDYGQGWEHELTEYSLKEYRQRRKEYQENCPQYPTKLVRKRERLAPDIKLNPEGIKALVIYFSEAGLDIFSKDIYCQTPPGSYVTSKFAHFQRDFLGWLATLDETRLARLVKIIKERRL